MAPILLLISCLGIRTSQQGLLDTFVLKHVHHVGYFIMKNKIKPFAK